MVFGFTIIFHIQIAILRQAMRGSMVDKQGDAQIDQIYNRYF